MTISATVVLDSVSACGVRLTTLELTYPRFILAELNTHRVFSRNTASSRAIPLQRVRDSVQSDPALPIRWGANGRGMQDHGELSEIGEWRARNAVRELLELAVGSHYELERIGLHKQVANRYLEPWMHARTLVSATEWENFFRLRDHADAQPEMFQLAREMRRTREESAPVTLLAGQWHLPLVKPEERVHGLAECLAASAARCARISYGTHRTERVWDDEVAMGRKLLADGHLSPWEHQAQSMPRRIRSGNFVGWKQARKMVEGVRW